MLYYLLKFSLGSNYFIFIFAFSLQELSGEIETGDDEIQVQFETVKPDNNFSLEDPREGQFCIKVLCEYEGVRNNNFSLEDPREGQFCIKLLCEYEGVRNNGCV